MVPQSDPIWQVLRVLPYLQFSYRLLGVLVPCLAWLAGGLIAWIAARRPRLQLGAAALVAGLSLLAAVPFLTPLPWPEFGPVTPKAIYALELSGQRGVGTTNDGEFLPITVLNKPAPNPAITAAVNAGTIEKVDRAALPANTGVTITGHNTLQDTFDIQAPNAFVLRVLTFYWPGWTAYLDGAPVPIQVTNPEGFISVAIGRQPFLPLRLQNTPTQRLSWIISGGAGAAARLLLVAPVWRVSRLVLAPATHPMPPCSRETSGPGWLAVARAVAAAAKLLRLVGMPAHVECRARRAPGSGGPGERFTRFDEGSAGGYDFPDAQARPGDKLSLTLYSEVTRPTQQEASAPVHPMAERRLVRSGRQA
jgi:hypothetical protein